MDDGPLIELIRRYALHGIKHWRSVSQDLKTRAARHLGSSIAENEGDIEQAVNTWLNKHNADRLFYIPMPKHSNQIDQAFFLPIRERAVEGTTRTSFDLFLIVTKDRADSENRDHCLALRWEQAEEPESTHGYAHVQLCKSTAKRSRQHAEIPPWLPDSYPAIPIGSSDPVQMFLSMVTSVHGYEGGMREMLVRLFNNNIGMMKDYQQRLQKQLAI